MARVAVGNNGPIIKWNAAGQLLEGTYLGLRNGKKFANNPEPSKLVDIRKPDGTQVTAGAPTALAGKLSDLKPGTYVWIKYDGTQRGQSGTEFKAFTVEIDVPDGTTPPPGVQPAGTAISGLEQKLRSSKGDQTAGLMIDALKMKFPDPAAYEKAVRDLLTAHGIA